MHICVVGAGVMGLCTAYSLLKRGHNVTIFDQFEPGHNKGSSHGKSRIVRKDYPDPFYAEIMIEGYPLWLEMDKVLGGDILFETGLVYFGDEHSQNMISLLEGSRNLGIPFKIYQAHNVKEVFPALILEPHEIAYFNQNAGWVHAENLISRLFGLCLEHGATFAQIKVNPHEIKSEFDAMCLLQGGWTKHNVVTPVCQTFAYMDVGQSSSKHTPVWIEDQEHENYGFPPEPGSSRIKFGVHKPGPKAKMDTNERIVLQEYVETLEFFAKKRLGISQPKIEEVTSCIYAMTPNSDFVWGERESGIFWASPCSGHGFKFGPWIGERMADFVESKKHPQDYPRFYQQERNA